MNSFQVKLVSFISENIYCHEVKTLFCHWISKVTEKLSQSIFSNLYTSNFQGWVTNRVSYFRIGMSFNGVNLVASGSTFSILSIHRVNQPSCGGQAHGPWPTPILTLLYDQFNYTWLASPVAYSGKDITDLREKSHWFASPLRTKKNLFLCFS